MVVTGGILNVECGGQVRTLARVCVSPRLQGETKVEGSQSVHTDVRVV